MVAGIFSAVAAQRGVEDATADIEVVRCGLVYTILVRNAGAVELPV
jgi:hypothetical protein